jgi:hypothetical protein
MNEFDPTRAAREALAGLTEVYNTLRRQERTAELRMSEAENDLNSLRKLVGYMRIQIEAQRYRVNELEGKVK